MTDIREEFDKWFNSTDRFLLLVMPFEDAAYDIWQAAHASRDAEVAELKKRVEEFKKDAMRFREYRDNYSHTCPKDDWVKSIDRSIMLKNPPKPPNRTRSA